MKSFADCVAAITSYFNDSTYLTRTVGVKMDVALFNEARNNAELVARFPLRLHFLGYTQTDGPGYWQPIYHCAIFGKMARSEETDGKELDLVRVAELTGLALHQHWHGGFSCVVSKCFTFDTPMTLTSENRRIQVSLGENEIGFAVFFYATEIEMTNLVEGAENETVSPLDVQVWNESENAEAGGGSGSAEIGDIAGLAKTAGKQIF